MYNILFFALVIPSFLTYLYTHREQAWGLVKNPIALAFAPFFIYTMLHGFLFLDAEAEPFKTFRNCWDTLLFFACGVLYFQLLDDALRTRALTTIAYVAGICSVISLGIFLIDPPSDPRILPLGRAAFQLPAAAIYGFGMICALTALHSASSRKHQLLLVLSTAAIFAVIILTQARLTGFVCLLALIVLGGMSCMKYKRVALTLIAALITASLLAPLMVHMNPAEFASALMQRGTSYRLELWGIAWDAIFQHPWTGTGSSIVEHKETNSPHNLFLATAMLMGLPALFLLLVALANLGLRLLANISWKNPYHLFIIFSLMNGIGLCLFDYNRVVSSSSPLWIIFWLPLAMAVGELLRQRAELRKG